MPTRIVSWRTRSLKAQGKMICDQSKRDNRSPDPEKASSEAGFFTSTNFRLCRVCQWHLIERALAFVTIYSGRPQVNVLDAAPEVLAALPGMNNDRLEAVLARAASVRRSSQALLQFWARPKRYATTDGSKASRVTIQITYDNGRQGGFGGNHFAV